MTPFLSGTIWVLAPAASSSRAHAAMSVHASQSTWVECAAASVMPWPAQLPAPAAIALFEALSEQAPPAAVAAPACRHIPEDAVTALDLPGHVPASAAAAWPAQCDSAGAVMVTAPAEVGLVILSKAHVTGQAPAAVMASSETTTRSRNMVTPPERWTATTWGRPRRGAG